MILLDSATVLQLVSSVGGLPVDVNWVDLQGQGGNALVNPNFTDSLVAGPGTTTIAPSPPVTLPATNRSIQYVAITNSTGVSATVTVQKFNGAGVTPVYPTITLPAGYGLIYNEDSGWDVVDTSGRRLVNVPVASVSAGIGAISAGTQSATSGTVVFSNLNGVTFGMLGSSVVTASIAAVGSLNLSAGTTSNNLSAVTFANSNGVSFGLNNSTLTASVAVLAATIRCFSQDADFVTNSPVAQAALSIQKVSLPMNLTATQLAVIGALSGNRFSSGAVTLNHAIYTFNLGTASLASSASRAFSWTSGSATTATSVYGGASGTRYRTMPVSYAMTPGDYLFAWVFSTANGESFNVFGRAGLNLVGTFDGVETSQFLNGTSVSTVAGFPNSIAATNTGYARTGFSAMFQPGALLAGTG